MMLPSFIRSFGDARHLTIAVPASNCARSDTGATRVDERSPQSPGTRDRPEADQGSTGVFAGATRRREAPTLSRGRRRIRERTACSRHAAPIGALPVAADVGREKDIKNLVVATIEHFRRSEVAGPT